MRESLAFYALILKTLMINLDITGLLNIKIVSKVLQKNIARCDQKCQRKSAGFFFRSMLQGSNKGFFHKVVYIFFSIRAWKNRGLGSCFCLAVGKRKM